MAGNKKYTIMEDTFEYGKKVNYCMIAEGSSGFPIIFKLTTIVIEKRLEYITLTVPGIEWRGTKYISEVNGFLTEIEAKCGFRLHGITEEEFNGALSELGYTVL
jgi:hypothetical protein